MITRFHIHTRGQLAVGVAIAFIGVVSMFAFVFNTTMNVREKMAMQQTSDYAAAVASNSQRYALNQIRQMNQAIEALWFKSLVQQQADHCLRSPPGVLGPSITPGPIPNASGIVETVGVGTAAAMLAGALSPYASETAATVSNCLTACAEYNKAVNKKIRSDYKRERDLLAQQIMNVLMNTNERAYQLALRQFLAPSGLPWNLQQKLKQELGAGFNTQNVMSFYNQGRFSFDQNNREWGYEVISENAQDPLFIPENEIRPFVYLRHSWYTQPNSPPMVPTCVKASIPFSVHTKTSNVKIVKTTDFQPHFFTGINYLPPKNSFEENDALTKKQINAENFGKAEDRGEDIHMFRRKTMVGVRSVAKPFGGTFPSGLPTPSLSSLGDIFSSNIEVPSSFKMSAGQEFQGSKLFGIADSAEIGGYHLFRADIEATQQNQQGNEQNVWRILKEDYLH